MTYRQMHLALMFVTDCLEIVRESAEKMQARVANLDDAYKALERTPSPSATPADTLLGGPASPVTSVSPISKAPPAPIGQWSDQVKAHSKGENPDYTEFPF